MDLEQVRVQSLSANFLQLIIMPTEACNFRCTYCYETFEHKKMRPSVITGIKALIDHRSTDLDHLALDWFGGEPLLALSVISDISHHALGVAKAHGFKFSSGITTNAYFLDRTGFLTCLENGIGTFQISLDGDRDVHNASRKLASGAGTFDRVWKHVRDIKQTPGDFTILLRLHYTYENYRSVADFGRKINDMVGGDERFQCFFKSIFRLGGPNDDRITVIPSEQSNDIESYLWERSGLRKAQILAEPPVCYAGMGNSLVIRSTGHLAKCTVALTDEFNSIGHIREDGEITVDQEKFRRWIDPVVERRWHDAECPLASVARAALEAQLKQPVKSMPVSA